VQKYGKVIQDRNDNLIRRRKVSICMPDNWGKNTDTLITFNTYYFYTATMTTQKRLSVWLHLQYAAGLVKYLKGHSTYCNRGTRMFFHISCRLYHGCLFISNLTFLITLNKQKPSVKKKCSHYLLSDTFHAVCPDNLPLAVNSSSKHTHSNFFSYIHHTYISRQSFLYFLICKGNRK
jgi:hypothetical protein